MATQFPELFAALAEPFSGNEIRVRKQGGRDLRYITARTAMNRLDTVLGPENWTEDYIPGENSVICKLTIRLPDGSLLVKMDAGGYAGMADQGDDDKSGFSDAFKRAAVKLGIGRELYGDGVARFEPTSASPERFEVPRVPMALMGWAMIVQAKTGVAMVDQLTERGRKRGFPPRVTDWNEDQVAEVFEAASAWLDRRSTLALAQ